MKKRFVNLFMLATFTVAAVSCNDSKKNTVEPGEALDVATAGDEAQTFVIDTAASTIEWRGTKPTGAHIGTIDIQSGSISATNEEVQSGSVVIDMNTIAVLDEGMDEESRSNLENHLKGTVEGKETDFFNVNKYPTATFEITGITDNSGQKMMQGNLTIKEDTKNIEFPVNVSINGDELSLESDTFIIDRTDWKVNYRSQSVFENLGDNWISDDMELTIKVHATKQ